jgi:ankyrin repeat protein
VINHSYPDNCQGRPVDGRTPLHDACARSDAAAVRSLLGQGADPCAIDAAGESPLSAAIRAKSAGIIRLLVDAGALRANHQVRCPFLVHLPETGDRELFAYVLSRGRGLVDISDHDEDGRGAFHYALSIGHEKMLFLIISAGFDLNPLFITSARRGDYFYVKSCIDHGMGLIRVSATDGAGNSALHHAVMNNDARMARLLVASGAETSIRNAEGRTPAELAADDEMKSLFS